MTDTQLNSSHGNFQDGYMTIINLLHKNNDIIDLTHSSACLVKLLLSHVLHDEFGNPFTHIFLSPMVFSLELIDHRGNRTGIMVSSNYSCFLNELGEIIINGWYDANMTLFTIPHTKGYISIDIDGNYYLTN